MGATEDAAARRVIAGQKPKGIAGWGTSFLLVALAAAGCMGGSPPEAVDETTVVQAPARPFAELRVSAGPELDYVDPALALTASSWTLLWQVHVGLVTFRHAPGAAGARVVPALADDLPEISDDGLVYVFRLRPGLVYSDGESVRASDFRHAIERLERIESPGAHWFAVVREIRADDRARTVEFRLAEPRPDFLELLATPLAAPVPRGTPPLEQRRRLLPSTGPYRVQAFVPRQELVLVRNPRFRPVPGVPVGNAARIHVSLAGDGEADYALRGSGPELWYVFLNTQLPPFDRLEVRRAVAFALDRRALAEAVGGVPTENVLPRGVPGARRHALFRRSLPRAQRLVRQAQAGGTPVTVWVAAGSPGPLFVEQLRATGLAVRVRRLSAEDFFRAVSGRMPTAQAGIASWSSPLPHPFVWFDALLNGDRLGQPSNTNFSWADDPELNDRVADLRRRPLLTDEEAAGWAELDRLAVSRGLILPFAVRSERGVAGPRLDPSCRAGHAVFGVDLARLCPRKG